MSLPKVTVEVHFAQRLASNEKPTRDKTIKKLRLWMTVRSKSGKHAFNEEDFLKLWKGLFYCMWMCDKAVVQEELADNIAKLVHKLHTTDSALMFFKTFLKTMEREWHGIDRLRMDKYYMFIRRLFREQLEFVKQNHWDKEHIEAFLDVLKQGLLNPTSPTKALGLLHHISDIYLEELTGVGASQLSPQETLMFIDPFCILVAKTRNKSLMKTLLREIFEDIVVHSTVGMEEVLEEEKRLAKEQKEEDGEEESEEEEDPRLPFDYSAIGDRLFMLGSQKETPGLNRKKMYHMAQQFQDLAKGIYPIPDLEELAQISSEDEIEDDVKLKHKRKQKKRMLEAKMIKEKKAENGGMNGIKENKEENANDDLNVKKRKKKREKVLEIEENNSTETDVAIMGKLSQKIKLKKKAKVKKVEDDSKVEIVDMQEESTKVKKKKKKMKQDDQIVPESQESLEDKKVIKRSKGAKRKCQQVEEPFAAFQAVSTPPAIVLKKLVAPGTEIKKQKVCRLTGSAPPTFKKHVKITLSKNTNHKQSDYKKQVKCSPGIPFDSTKKPSHSALKSTPTPVKRTKSTPTPVKRTKTTIPATKLSIKKKNRRSSAADFF
ncbi:ribosomal RNA processing protein 1 homolog A-like [Antedon mediterranea]|uniref:ribosomal RNA processing protein 1 homolog A-like n=1 Tax=Antedon mediterranea TaxID=105859 RepID=UPI003AF53CAD